MLRLLALAVASLLVACASSSRPRAEPAPRPATASPSAFDGTPEALIASLRDADAAKLRAACTAALAAELDDRAVAELAATFEQLGDLRASHPVSEAALVGGGQRRSFLLRFVGGDADLELERDASGRLSSFHLAGTDFDRALAEARRSLPAALAVVELRFRGADGRELAADALVGRHVEYELSVVGLNEVAGAFHVSVAARIRDAGGKELYGRPIVFDSRFDAGPDGRAAGTVHGSFDLLAPGAHELTLEITDENGRATITHRARFVSHGAS